MSLGLIILLVDNWKAKMSKWISSYKKFQKLRDKLPHKLTLNIDNRSSFLIIRNTRDEFVSSYIFLDLIPKQPIIYFSEVEDIVMLKLTYPKEFAVD